MRVETTAIAEVKIITPVRHEDARGFFAETYNKRALAEAGIEIDFVQDNHSFSRTRGTLRGLHFQCPPAAQTKLVRVVRGAILDVVVDCRIGSPTYGRHVMVEISAAAGNQILCPKGFAHGTLTLEPDTELIYKVDAHYAPDLDRGIRFDDPDLAIPWPLPDGELLLSDRDRALPNLRDLPAVFHHP